MLAACACFAGYSQDTNNVQYQPLFKDSTTVGPTKIRLREAVAEDGSEMMMDKNGNVWKIFTQDGLDVLMNVRYQKNFGKYYRVDLYLQNNTSETVRFDFDNVQISTFDGPVKLFSQDKYLSREHSRKVWRNIGIGTATFFTGLFLEAIMNGGSSDSVGSDIAEIVLDEGLFVFSDLYMMKQDENMQEIVRKSIGYLRNYDIEPNNAIEGHAYAKYNPKAKSLNFSIPVNGQEYILSWDASSLEKVSQD